MNWKPQRHLSRAPAFTLIELVLVMALLAIVLAVAFPSLRNFFRGRNLDSEAHRFLALTRYAQSRAVSEGVPMVLWIDERQHTYGLQAQTGYLDEDDKAIEFKLDETLEFKVTAPLLRQTAMQRNEIAAVAGNLPAIRYSPDGFIGSTSPEEVTIRQGDEDAVVFMPNANRLNYEIQPTKPQLARR
jgi:type II secretion system protein H